MIATIMTGYFNVTSDNVQISTTAGRASLGKEVPTVTAQTMASYHDEDCLPSVARWQLAARSCQ